jgi:hypothetical protein
MLSTIWVMFFSFTAAAQAVVTETKEECEERRMYHKDRASGPVDFKCRQGSRPEANQRQKRSACLGGQLCFRFLDQYLRTDRASRHIDLDPLMRADSVTHSARA